MWNTLLTKALTARLLLFVLTCPLLAQEQTVEQDEIARAFNPPQILVAAAIDDDDNLVLVSYRTIHIGFEGDSYNNRSVTKVSLSDVKIANVKGEKLTIESARKQIGDNDMPILCSSWNTQLPDFYAAMFAPKTLHFIFPKRSPVWKEIEDPGRPVKR